MLDQRISYDGKTFVLATIENAKNKTYPVVRPLYFYYPTSKEAAIKPYLDFIMSTEGQKIVDQVGYIGLK